MKKRIAFNLAGVVLTALCTAISVWAAIQEAGNPAGQAAAIGGACMCAACTAIWVVLLMQSVSK